MANRCAGFGILPNEILITAFSFFPTRDLLPITLTSHRIYDLILRILHHRLIDAASLKHHKLILECYHPSVKWSTPFYLCQYVGTNDLNNNNEGDQIPYEDSEKTDRLGKLSNMYSYFQPLHFEGDRRRPLRPLPAGGWAPGPSDSLAEREGEFICQNIHLESHEMFSQLCVGTNLVKVGPIRGLFKSCVTIGEGTIRIFRRWLSERASMTENNTASAMVGRERCEKDILWTSPGKHVGLQMKVAVREDTSTPVMVCRDEDPSVSYTLQYEALVIRTVRLLLMVEKSIEQEVNSTGKAVVIGSWNP